MKIVYVVRGDLHTKVLGRLYHRFRRCHFYCDQDGFFEHSLENVAQMDEMRINETYNKSYDESHDLLLINWKQPALCDEQDRFSAIKKIVEQSSLPRALCINAAQAGYFPPEKVIDLFDFIIKREPYVDLSRYDISDANRQKIIPTIIHCPLYPSARSTIGAILTAFRPAARCSDKNQDQYDVGFLGTDAAEHTLRRDVWRRVKEMNVSTLGGLQPNPYTKEPLPPELAAPRLSGAAYVQSLCQSKINLAIRGIGEYTFRHQELLYLGKFLLSDSSIKDQNLIIPLQEGKHYIAFDTVADMEEKICYYLTHEDERQRIAIAGKKLFDQYYDPKRHGKSLLKALNLSK